MDLTVSVSEITGLQGLVSLYMDLTVSVSEITGLQGLIRRKPVCDSYTIITLHLNQAESCPVGNWLTVSFVWLLQYL